MSGTRQSELFAGQDWTVLYRAFTQVNFNSSDPPSINRALREYIRTAYPEDFNDWIESSEFVAILDLLSWLAGTLAYKTDLAARENFLDTAEARESILRLARFLSYNPSRARPATGILKVMAVQTDEDVQDAFGRSLAGTTVVWDDPDDPDWQEKFLAILNAAMVPTNPFGTPLRQEVIGNSQAALYRLNNLLSRSDPGFTSTVAGERMAFEAVNGDFRDGAIIERAPNPNAAMHLIGLADGNGNGSPRTGIFVVFKQGITARETFRVDTPIENQTLEPNAAGVSQDDVWVQTVDDNGAVIVDWTKVPAAFSDNITFNSLPNDQRDIFSVITRDDDRVTVRFSDGRFGNAPVGNIRVTYRSVNGLTYSIRPQEIDRIQIAFPYFARSGAEKRLILTVSLMEPVVNAAGRETEEEIRRRAPLVYATQNRMVSGEDYNTFPLLANLAIRIKALNRVYSGHSRHMDLHDPTGTFSDLTVIGDDGSFFRERRDAYTEIPGTLNRTPRQLVELHAQPMLAQDEVVRRMRDVMFDNAVVQSGLSWRRLAGTTASGGGYFDGDDSPLLRDGATLLFQWTADGRSQERWAAITDVRGPVAQAPGTGLLPPVILSEDIPDGAMVAKVVPRYAPDIQPSLYLGTGGMEDLVLKRLTFNLYYDFNQEPGSHWSAIEVGAAQPLDLILVVSLTYVPGSPGVWRIMAEGSRYVFESRRTVEFYTSGRAAVDAATGTQKRDVVRVLKFNSDVNNDGRVLGRDWDLTLQGLYSYPNGSYDPRRIVVDFADRDEDGVADWPTTFTALIDSDARNSTLFWRREGNLREVPIMPDDAQGILVYNGRDNAVGEAENTVVYDLRDRTFARRRRSLDTYSNGWEILTDHVARRGRGRNVATRWIDGGNDAPSGDEVNFLWKHYAPADHRIDPAPTNIHDIFVLTAAYDQSVRSWITAGAVPDAMPESPTELALRIAFAELEQFRMFSDQIVWRPVRYRFLFGPGSDAELRAQFKVVKLSNSLISDGEIRSRVIRAINEYFDAARWDFGETFYYTELAAYLHQQLAGVIGSIVVVPLGPDGVFGDGFEVRARPDEMFVSTAQVSDVVLINTNTATAIRSRR